MVAILDQKHIPQLTASPATGGVPPNLTLFAALIDTGASVTCISSKVVTDLGLQPSGKTMMSGSTGQNPVDQFTFCVGFIIGAQQNPTGTISGSLNLHAVQGCEFTNHGFGFDVLLGRDIICKGGLILTFDGHWTLAL